MKVFSKDNGDIRIGAIFTIGVLIVAIGVLFFNSLLSKITGLGFPDNTGSFGDQFGVLNTTFAGLAFVGVICALLQQQNQIRRQDTEFKNEKINFEKNNFNDHFYRLFNHASSLALQVKTQESIISAPTQTVQGLDAFANIYNYFNIFNDILMNYYECSMKNNKENETFVINIPLLNICKTAFGELASWSYIINKMLKTTYDSTCLSEKEKKDYMELVFFSLSGPQCQLMKFIEHSSKVNVFSSLERKYILYDNTEIDIFSRKIDWDLWNIVIKNHSKNVQKELDNIVIRRKKSQ